MGHFAVNRPVSVLMLTLVMLLFGAAAYMKLPRDLFPDVSQPGLMVRTEYEGAASRDIEKQISEKLEEKLGSVKGIKSMKSVSGDERSDIHLTFDWGTDMDLAAMDVRAKLDEVRDDLPEDAEDPVVLRTSAGAAGVVVLNIAPSNNPKFAVKQDELREQVEKIIKPRLERVDGVAAIGIAGGKTYEVRVRVLPEKLYSYKLSILDIRDALERENLSQRGGKLQEESTQFLIRTVGTYTIKDLGELIVSCPGQSTVRLKQVADLHTGLDEKDAESSARLKTSSAPRALPSVEVSIFKKSGGNSVVISESVRLKRLEILYDLAVRNASAPAGVSRDKLAPLAAVPDEGAIPPELKATKEFVESTAPFEIVITYDEATFIKESLEMVRSNGMQGLILASIILLVFLRRIQSTLIVALSMPVSVIATFSLFYAGGLSVNIFSMAGLTLAVGMVVDNAIVVTESIFHKLQHERRVKKAIIDAVTEIGPAVWASTLTTMAVFLPIVFVPGIAGQIFRDLSWVITYTLIFSIIVAFTLIPMLTMKVMNIEFAIFDLINKLLNIIMIPLSKLGGAFIAVYRVVIGIFVNKLPARVTLVFTMLALLVGTIFIMPASEFFPETKVESYSLTARPRVGQTLQSVDEAAKKIETMLAAESKIIRFNATVTPREIKLIATFDKARVMDGEIVPANVLGEIQKRIDGDALLADRILDHKIESLNPMKSLLGTTGGDIILKIRGMDLNKLREIMSGVDGESGLCGDLQKNSASLGIASIGKVSGAGVPEWVLRIRRNEAADKGLTSRDISDQIETAVAGSKATDLSVNDVTYDIVLSSGAKLGNKKDLLNLDIMPSGGGRPVKLREVATLTETEGPLAIYREERERTLYIPIFVDKVTSTLGEVVQKLTAAGGPFEKAITPYKKEGYSIRLGGASEEMNKSLGYMLYAFIVAVVLVYMVMASQFESLIHPFTIMFSVPLSLIGAVLGLKLSGDSLSLTAVIGVIMLAGIVVNNAIILIDYINILRARGMTRNEAIEEAGVTRLRPIFMTTLTTVLGMGPLALGLGTGAELYKPLAVVVVGGLGLSTLLTLVFIPAMYCLFDDISDMIGFAVFRLSMMTGKGGKLE